MIAHFAPLLGKPPSKFAEGLQTSTLRSEEVYGNYALSQSFLKCLAFSTRYSVREYWKDQKKATLHDLAV